MSKLVTIYGGSGFVGRYIAQRMARQGWRVRVACRRPNEAMFVRTYGVVGQVEPVLCNIRNDASVAQVMQGADAVINCVGILAERGKNSFDAVQSEGAERIAHMAATEGVGRFVHVSAIGADMEVDLANVSGENDRILKCAAFLGRDDGVEADHTPRGCGSFCRHRVFHRHEPMKLAISGEVRGLKRCIHARREQGGECQNEQRVAHVENLTCGFCAMNRVAARITT